MAALGINLTLVVQMIHFFIAYMVIKYLFLKPGYAVVATDAHRLKQIRSRIVARQELIAHKNTYKQTRWNLFKDFFYKQKPQVRKEYTVSTAPIVQKKVPEVSLQELDKVARTVADALNKKVLQ